MAVVVQYLVPVLNERERQAAGHDAQVVESSFQPRLIEQEAEAGIEDAGR